MGEELITLQSYIHSGLIVWDSSITLNEVRLSLITISVQESSPINKETVLTSIIQ